MLPRLIIGLYTYKVQVQDKTWYLINTHNFKFYITHHVYTTLSMHAQLMHVPSMFCNIDKTKHCYFVIPRTNITLIGVI
jgi:hypothetical protein